MIRMGYFEGTDARLAFRISDLKSRKKGVGVAGINQAAVVVHYAMFVWRNRRKERRQAGQGQVRTIMLKVINCSS